MTTGVRLPASRCGPLGLELTEEILAARPLEWRAFLAHALGGSAARSVDMYHLSVEQGRSRGVRQALAGKWGARRIRRIVVVPREGEAVTAGAQKMPQLERASQGAGLAHYADVGSA